METTHVKQLSEQLGTASAEIKAKYEALERKYDELEQHVTGIETNAKSWRPYGGSSMQDETDPELTEFLQKGTMPTTETKELSVTNDGQGVTVRGEWSDRIVSQVRETSPIRGVASQMQTSTNALELLVDRGEVGSAWISELGDRVKTSDSFMSRHPIPVDEHYALVEATLQMLEDSSFDVETWLQGKISQRFTRQENTAFMLGDGGGQPQGLLTYATVPDADHTWGADPSTYTLGATYSGAAGDITDADALFDLVDTLKADYLPGASWLMPRAVRNKVRKLKDAENRYLFEPALTAGVPDTLLGFPVVLCEDMDAPAADTIGALFGNFQEGYTVVDRLGTDIIRDPYSRPGFVRWYARKRVGGAVSNPEAIKALVLGTAPA